jgi:glycosyltransferase involved in cell wall biosynthesis
MMVDAMTAASARSSGRSHEVVVLGVSPDMKGGIASVMQVYRVAGLDRRVPMRWIATASDGSRWNKSRIFLGAVVSFLRLAISGRVALAHMMMSTGGSFWRKSILIRLCHWTRVPAVLHIHSGLFDRFHDDGPAWRRLYIRRTLARASHVIVLGDYWARRLQPIVPQGRLLTVPNGVHLPPSNECAIGVREGRDTLLFLGRLTARKGIFEAIRAFALVADEFPALQLVCGGDGDPTPIKSEIDGLPSRLRERIVLAGWIEANDQPGWLRRSLALVLPSHVENLPMCVLEAQAHGVPVVATPVGAVPEAVVHGATGFLTAVGDVNALAGAFRTIAGSDQTWITLSHGARRHIEANYAAAVTVSRVEALYRTYLFPPAADAAPAVRPP